MVALLIILQSHVKMVGILFALLWLVQRFVDELENMGRLGSAPARRGTVRSGPVLLGGALYGKEIELENTESLG